MSIAVPDPSWIKQSDLRVGQGVLPSCTVLKKASPESYHQFVVSDANWMGDHWDYYRGDYHHTIEEALKNPRLKGAN